MTPKSGDLVALGLPDLTPVQRQYINGYFVGVLELTGAKQIKVTRHDADPQAWRWSLSWE